MNNKEYLRGYNAGKKKKIQIGDLRSTPNSRFHLGLKKGRQEREEEIIEMINQFMWDVDKALFSKDETGRWEMKHFREHNSDLKELIKKIKSKEVLEEWMKQEDTE